VDSGEGRYIVVIFGHRFPCISNWCERECLVLKTCYHGAQEEVFVSFSGGEFVHIRSEELGLVVGEVREAVRYPTGRIGLPGEKPAE
jgi:hypothetical protein